MTAPAINGDVLCTECGGIGVHSCVCGPPVVTFRTNAIAAGDIVSALEWVTVLLGQSRDARTEESVSLLRALMHEFRHAATEARS